MKNNYKRLKGPYKLTVLMINDVIFVRLSVILKETALSLRIKEIIMIRVENVFRKERDHLMFIVLISQSQLQRTSLMLMTTQTQLYFCMRK